MLVVPKRRVIKTKTYATLPTGSMIIPNYAPRKLAVTPRKVRYNLHPMRRKLNIHFSVPRQSVTKIIAPLPQKTRIASPFSINTLSIPKRTVITPSPTYSNTENYVTKTTLPTTYEVFTSGRNDVISSMAQPDYSKNVQTSQIIYPTDNYNIKYSTTDPYNTQIYGVNTNNTQIYKQNAKQIPAPIPTVAPSFNYSFDGIEPSENFNPNDFILMRLIGRGGYSEIFSVKWKKNGKTYIMKKCTSHDATDITNERTQAKAVINFIRSTRCEGVVKIYGEKIMGNTQYILMELAGNDWEKELNDRKISQRYYSEYELLNIARQLIQTLALLERYSISHRDIKPKNILITNGIYKLADFSDSKNVPEGKATLLLRGTEIFMSPLLYNAYLNNNALLVHDSYKSDVFSLGMCILYAACLNYNPLEKIRNIKDERELLHFLKCLLANRYTARLIKIIFWMLQFDENKRPNFVQLETMI